jgi:glycosyltransferase involved in cell wall biosynthesis
MRSNRVCLPLRGQPEFVKPQVPLITIGITCFNAARTIARAVDSAVKQDWPNTEIIVVDDASTDGSDAVFRKIAQQHPHLRIIRHKNNEGYAGALNTIVKASRGEFVAIFDDDDESRSDRLATQWRRVTDYEKLHANKLVLCYSNRGIVRDGETKPHHVSRAIGREAPEPNGPIVAKYLFGANFLFGPLADHVWGMFGRCTLMARRRTLITVGDFDASFRRCAEWDFAVRAALQGAHFIAVNEPLITQYKTSSDDKSGKTPLKYALKLTRKHKDYLINEKAYLASKAWAHARFHWNNEHRWRHRLFVALAFGLLPSSTLVTELISRLVPATPRAATVHMAPVFRSGDLDVASASRLTA